MAQKNERWGTRLGVILAVAGSAVGLGNFLRFPGEASQHGGGAFMIPYFIALVLLGIPVAWAEWTMGRYGGRKGFHSTPAIMGVISKGRIGRYLGVTGVLIPLVIYMYYVNIEAWCLRYAWEYLAGNMDVASTAAGAEQVFNSVTGADQDGILLGGGLHPSVVVLGIVFLLNFFFLYRGLSRGIERFCMVAMPVMAVLAVIVLIRVLTLGTPDPAKPDQNVLTGLGFMWNPDLSELGEWDTWLAAAGQIFFSLSVGFGVIVNYASYMRKKDDVVLSGLTAVSTNGVFEVGFGGLITIPAAFIFLGAAGALQGGFGLGFNALPVVFEHMGAFGRFAGFAWFFMLFLAAITSSLSMLQPVKAFLAESLGMSLRASVLLLGVVTAMGAFWVVWFSQGLVALDTMDFWVGTVFIYIMAGVQIIAFGWVFGIERGIAEAHDGAHMRIPRIFQFIIKYVSPFFLISIFVGFCWQKLGGYIDALGDQPVAARTIGVIAVVLALLVGATVIGERRWRKEGRDLDGVEPAPETEED